MAETNSERVTCPDCEKSYRWQDTLAGRTVPCKQCGTKFIVPDAPGIGQRLEPETDDGIYELDTPEIDQPRPLTTPAVGGKCPKCNSPVKEHAVICMNCGFNMQAGTTVQTAVKAPADEPDHAAQPGQTSRLSQREQYKAETEAAMYKQHRWDEIYFPLIVLGVGLVLMLINAFALTPPVNRIYNQQGISFGLSTGEAIAVYLIGFILILIMMIPLLLGGIFFMASVFGSAFGNLFTAVLKLLAMVVLVVAFDGCVDLVLELVTGGFGGIAWLIRITLVLAVFYPLCIKLFDMESHEIWVMFFLYVIGPIAIGFLAMILIMSFF